MNKLNFKNIITIGIKSGLLSGAIAGIYEIIKFLVNDGLLFSGMASILYLVVFLLLTPLATFLLVKEEVIDLSYFQNFSILLISYFLSIVITSMVLILIHYGIDVNFRERIAEFKIENIIASNENMEKEMGAKIVSTDLDFEKIRSQEVSNFELAKLIKAPLFFFPFALLFSLAFSYVFSVIDRFRSLKKGYNSGE